MTNSCSPVCDDEVDREGDGDTAHYRDVAPPPQVETAYYSILLLGYQLVILKYF